MMQELLRGSIPPRIQIIAIASSLSLLLFIITLIRRGLLKEGYSIIWLITSLAIVMLSCLAGLLDIIARLLGIRYAPIALLVIFIAGLTILAIHVTVLLSKYDTRIRTLAQEHAILKAELRQANGKQRNP